MNGLHSVLTEVVRDESLCAGGERERYADSGLGIALTGVSREAVLGGGTGVSREAGLIGGTGVSREAGLSGGTGVSREAVFSGGTGVSRGAVLSGGDVRVLGKAASEANLREEGLALTGYAFFHGVAVSTVAQEMVRASPAGVRGWAHFEKWRNEREGRAVVVEPTTPEVPVAMVEGWDRDQEQCPESEEFAWDLVVLGEPASKAKLEEESMALSGYAAFHGVARSNVGYGAVRASPAGVRGWARFEEWRSENKELECGGSKARAVAAVQATERPVTGKHSAERPVTEHSAERPVGAVEGAIGESEFVTTVEEQLQRCGEGRWQTARVRGVDLSWGLQPWRSVRLWCAEDESLCGWNPSIS